MGDDTTTTNFVVTSIIIEGRNEQIDRMTLQYYAILVTLNTFVYETPYVKSYAAGRKYLIRQDITCFMYQLPKQGVGSTLNWKYRLNKEKKIYHVEL